jgi:hypothetical protein
MEGSAMDGPEMPVWLAYLRPREIPLWVTYAASFALILTLYVVKLLALRHPRSRVTSGAIYLAATAAAVPVTYLLGADWGNEFVDPAALYVGDPVTTLAIPCASIAWDWAKRPPERALRDWLWRAPLKIVIAVPLWLFFWVYVEFLVLGWVWIECSTQGGGRLPPLQSGLLAVNLVLGEE